MTSKRHAEWDFNPAEPHMHAQEETWMHTKHNCNEKAKGRQNQAHESEQN